jgi:predicted phosphoribosyltransferase
MALTGYEEARMPFRDRREAGRYLATKLTQYANRSDVLVLALPRGGVPVGHEVSCALRAPLDAFLVRKLGVPGREELAMGAVASGGVLVLNRSVVEELHIDRTVIDAVSNAELRELQRQERLYRGSRGFPEVRGRTVILVDDGLATGATMWAAAAALRRQAPARIVVAVPVGAPQVCAAFRRQVEESVCAITPERLHAVGTWYEDFSQVPDDEVRALLAAANSAISPLRA